MRTGEELQRGLGRLGWTSCDGFRALQFRKDSCLWLRKRAIGEKPKDTERLGKDCIGLSENKTASDSGVRK